jgi:YYY domain-containing protein
MLDKRLAFLFRALVSVLWRSAILFAVATVTFYPYTKYYATAYAGLQTWKEATTKIPDYLTVHGFFLTLITIYLISEWMAQVREERFPAWPERIARNVLFRGPFVVAALILLLGLAVALKVQIWLIALPLATMAAVLALGRDLPPTRRLALLLIALGLAITMGVEVVRQKDDIGRMNTVFKFYVQAWVLFGVGCAFGLAHWAERARKWTPGWRRLAWAITLILFVGVMLYPLTAARAKVRDRFSEQASPHGLDGIAYMDKAQFFDNNRDMRLADDKAAIQWMLHNVVGSPVILEGNTPGYRWGSRYSIYTGLPDVQGWDWHQKQQRSVVPHTEIDRRLAHVREIYNTADLARARHLLDLYKVSYIVVGELERAYYNPQGLAKFDTLVGQGYLRLAYEGGTVRIYQVVERAAPAAARESNSRTAPPDVRELNSRTSATSATSAPAPQASQTEAAQAVPPAPRNVLFRGPEATLPAERPL